MAEKTTIGRLAIAIMRLERRVSSLESDLADMAVEAVGADDQDDDIDGKLPPDLLSLLKGAKDDPEVQRLVGNVTALAGG